MSEDQRPVAWTADELRAHRGGSGSKASALVARLAFLVEIVTVLALVINIAITSGNALGRYFFDYAFAWSTDAWAILISIITFLGAAAYYRRGPGMAYTALIERSGAVWRDILQACGLVIFLGVNLMALVAYPAFLAGQNALVMPVLGISGAYTVMWLGIGLVLFAVFTVEKLVHLRVGAIAIGTAIASSIAIAALALRWAYATGAVEMEPFILVLPALMLAFLTAVPIAGILALGGMLYFIYTGDATIVLFPSSLQYGVNSFILLAIPFFMLVGTLMEVTGMAKRMIDSVQEWVGHWPGGLLIAEIVGMYVFSGVSGSKGADMATVGSVMKQPLREYGYPATESVAVLAAAAAMGETIPPSLALLVLGSITTLSIGSLFVAGIIPAAILAIALIIAVLIRSRLHGFHKGPRFNLPRALKSMPLAIPAFMVPVIVVGGIVGGVASPTESATFAVIYGFVVALLFYRSVGMRTGWIAMRDATLIAGMVLFMICGANLLSQAIVTDGLGRSLAAEFTKLQSPAAFMFLSMVVMIIIGIILEGLPALLIGAPILLPIATNFDVDPLQFGIMITMATGIGVFLPPVGIGYYVACAIGESPVNETMRPSFVYNVFLVLGLVVVILFPELTVWLPHYFGLH